MAHEQLRDTKEIHRGFEPMFSPPDEAREINDARWRREAREANASRSVLRRALHLGKVSARDVMVQEAQEDETVYNATSVHTNPEFVKRTSDLQEARRHEDMLEAYRDNARMAQHQ